MTYTVLTLFFFFAAVGIVFKELLSKDANIHRDIAFWSCLILCSIYATAIK